MAEHVWAGEFRLPDGTLVHVTHHAAQRFTERIFARKPPHIALPEYCTSTKDDMRKNPKNGQFVLQEIVCSEPVQLILHRRGKTTFTLVTILYQDQRVYDAMVAHTSNVSNSERE